MLGPVFSWELVRAGRRCWHWWARALYVGLLLLLLYAAFESRIQFSGNLRSHQILAQIGASFYGAFCYCQLFAVLLLAPIYAATSVSEEKTRQTLPFLLTSQLSDAEIVFSKLGLAVLRVWEVLLCGLPLCAVCLLLGGVSPELVVLDFAVALMAAWASCALGVLAAICNRRLVEALFGVFLAQLLWYVLPVVDVIARLGGTGFYVPGWILDMNAFRAIFRGQTAGAANWLDNYLACLVSTSLVALIASIAAWCVLRSAWRREEQRSGTLRSLFAWVRRPRKAEAVWDDPLLWRELRSRRSTSVDRIGWALYVAGSLAVLVSIAINWEASIQILSVRPLAGMPPAALIIAVYAVFLHLAFLGLPFLTITGASAFAEERDGNQFELLRVTLLEQRNLINAKTVRLSRVGAGMLLFPMILEVLIFAMGWATWPALVLTLLHFAAAGAFWLMLGMAVGLRLAKTSQAIVTALATLLIVNLLAPWVLMMFGEERNLPFALVSSPGHCMFLQIADNLIEQNNLPGNMTVAEFRGLSLFYTLSYSIGAALMYLWALAPAGPWKTGREDPVQAVVNRRRLEQPISLPASP